MDFVHILWYSFRSMRLDKLPYIDDLTASLNLLSEHGGSSIAMLGASWALQISIIFSCILFLAQLPTARYLAYMQAPFRLILATPSLSVLIVGADLLSVATASVLITVLVVGELIKIWTLYKYH